MTKKINFLDLGKHPITNNFLELQNPKNEFFYNLKLILIQKQNLFHLKSLFLQKKCLMINMRTERQLLRLCV